MKDEFVRKRLARYTVGVAGCGGLGSNCAVALARVGIGKLVLADFDKVELSNLNRQYFFVDQLGELKVDALKENIGRIDKRVSVEVFSEKLTRDNIAVVFHHCDVIVEAFDLADQKQMIIETVLSLMPQIPLVAGSGMAGWGHSNLIRAEQYGNLYLCGDQITEVTEDLPPLAPRVGMVAAMQANVVMEILMENSVK